MITAAMVKELRERTGSGMMDCKKALNETNGDMDKAIEVLREKGLAAATKKAGRIAAEGVVVTYISEDMKTGAVVEVNCETDFVAANEDFKALADNVAKMVVASEFTTVEELLAAKYVGDESMTLQEAVTALIAKLGENMSVRRFEKFVADNGIVQSYIHGGGKIGVLVQLSCEKQDDVLKTVAKDVAMQVAAANPLFLNRDQVDSESLEKEKEIYRVQALNEGKPENIVEKMVMGRISKYYKEVCLVDQVWVKNGDYTIAKYVAEEGKKIGAAVEVVRFARFERGEGIEKKEENFAEEVQRQVSGK
ncbi:MAG: translation elongation factor Ts [Clostridium sp.]|uniref:translation elongation factor Ts n=1 Tax=Clostridium culturomicium TaxID=1499683 RepID=UPI0005902067|nr:translation elongation factor Ts [Clostridium culturomicium]MDU4889047.1 translation elongation factor Ts [Clostridium sp.]MDU7083309.1 translation elongation factor Ts [Clostridium sp.]